jgi:protein tyrosine phosphatase (PTP) superfamily phosphohydrolase (DUF442 family)
MAPESLNFIRNFLPLTDRVGTAGQPTTEQFSDIAAAGYEVVINLALPTSTYALPEEQSIVAGHGMHYVHIPVDSTRPPSKTPGDFSMRWTRRPPGRCSSTAR